LRRSLNGSETESLKVMEVWNLSSFGLSVRPIFEKLNPGPTRARLARLRRPLDDHGFGANILWHAYFLF
jgi:hypothetical protein